MHAASVHVSVEGDPRLTDARACTAAVKELMRREFGIDHATVELETSTGTVCAPDPGVYDACAVVQDHLEPTRRRPSASSRK
jgi:hypothetical protein